MKPIRVLVVDDSSFVRKALSRIFEAEADIELAGTASSGREAIEKVKTLRPDVVTLDIIMPEMDGLETLKALMDTRPTPVLMLSQFTKDGAELTLKALELGAMDFVDKSASGLMDFFDLGREIVSKVRSIAGGRPVRIEAGENGQCSKKTKGLIDVVAVGASTGGPIALQILLSKFPKDIGFSLLVVQHMPHGFTGPLAKRLDGACEIHVKEAEDGDSVDQPGTALIAPAGLHMKLKRSSGIKISLELEPLNEVHRPSIDVLFTSVAKHFGRRALGVILTGMGSDGALGMMAIKEAGGTTLAQDQATSAIYGMPRVAVEKGAVDRSVPITSMSLEIMKLA